MSRVTYNCLMASGSWFHNFRAIAIKDADLEQKNVTSIELSTPKGGQHVTSYCNTISIL